MYVENYNLEIWLRLCVVVHLDFSLSVVIIGAHLHILKSHTTSLCIACHGISISVVKHFANTVVNTLCVCPCLGLLSESSRSSPRSRTSKLTHKGGMATGVN